MARFNLDFARAFAIILRAVRAAYFRSASVALRTLGPRNECSERNSPNTSAEGTISSGPRVSWHVPTDKLGRNFFFSLGRSIRGFRNVRLIGSWYLPVFQVHCGFVFQIFAIRHHGSHRFL